MLPKLKFLDSRKVSTTERKNSIDFVANMNDDSSDHISMFSPADLITRLTRRNKVAYEYNALPTPKRGPGEHRGMHTLT